MDRSVEVEFARVAAVIGEPARAAMLGALLGGEPLTAGELARRAGVTPATASGHLARLADSGLVTCAPAGRRRYYALAGADAAAVLEALARITRTRSTTAGGVVSPRLRALRFARTCYDHLAGTIGVLLADTLVTRGHLKPGTFELTASGADWLKRLGIDVDAMRRGRRPTTRPCLDWSERREHLAGAAGAALASALLERRWIARIEGSRAVRLTVRGRDGLQRLLSLEVPPGPS